MEEDREYKYTCPVKGGSECTMGQCEWWVTYYAGERRVAKCAFPMIAYFLEALHEELRGLLAEVSIISRR